MLFHFSVNVNVRHGDYLNFSFGITVTYLILSAGRCSKRRLFQALTEWGISVEWSAPASRFPSVSGEILTGNQSPLQKEKHKNNWKRIPTNANSLLLNCFSLAWSAAKRVWSGMMWKWRGGHERGSTAELNYEGSLFKRGACDLFFREIFTR